MFVPMCVRTCVRAHVLPVYSAQTSLEEIQKKHSDELVFRADAAEIRQSKHRTFRAGLGESERASDRDGVCGFINARNRRSEDANAPCEAP